MLAALMVPPVILAMGTGLDYIEAAAREDKLNGIADAAALAAVTPAMMLKDTTAATAAACALFQSQASAVAHTDVSSFNCNDSRNINIQDSNTGTNIIRTATITYGAASSNVFARVLALNNLAISGHSQAQSTLSPRTDFYLMIDTSPSMEIPSTTAGINMMVNNTPGEGGCAFACHETNPTSGDTYDGSTNASSDNYHLARNLGVTLRIDLVNQAVQDLMSTAPAFAATNNTVYQVALYTIDLNLAQIYPVNTMNPVTGPPISPAQLPPNANFSSAQTAAGTIAPLTIYSNNYPTAGNNNQDEDSWLDMGLQQLNAIMPDPGHGGSDPGDTPREVLFIISDALPDYSLNGGRSYGPINTHSDWCTTIKNRKIRIAFLYLTYNSFPATSGNSWYTTYIAPIQSQIQPAALACASPGLFFQVNTNGDISAALQALFQKTVATAFLTM